MNGNRIKCILSFLAGCISFYLFGKLKSVPQRGNDKDRKYCQLFDNWLIITERGDKIEQYFNIRNIKEIAVYGYGNIGRHLITQLSHSNVHIKYVIDKRKGSIMTDHIPCYQLTESLEDVDAVIVTPICEYKEIHIQLKDRFSVPIISIEDIIYELL